jgi:hypothetical protein
VTFSGLELNIKGSLLRVGKLAAEGFEFVESPEETMAELKRSGKRVDIFTFVQRLPHTSPEYSYPSEPDNVAALPVSTFDEWWNHQIDGKTRNMVRRAEKKGIIVKEVPFDDDLARGIQEIYNETPVRQGRQFPHYGKDFETVRRMSATFLDKSVFIGAYLEEHLIGFAKLTLTPQKSQATVMHILAAVQHRDKAPTNALIAGAVRSCAERGVPYLVYSNFSYLKKERDSLAEFKENNGFQKIDLPRYYVPLNALGRLGLHLGLHHGLMQFFPEPLLAKLRDLRRTWYSAHSRFRMQPQSK